ncbi:hypothetical protein LTS18_014075 [Coniosporium uncinatum]|uniref:Uncharacterized protein n=1 Tax=Coniosporium uncinatum TaxID=93489 RepID=A0ACC3DBS7_9PEZI|nr:hypothetical protein LTS18_014075 [Coniosporium uncinatum]
MVASLFTALVAVTGIIAQISSATPVILKRSYDISTSEHFGIVGNTSIVPVTWTGPIDSSGANVTIKANTLEQVYHKAREINPDFGQTASTVNTGVESINVEARSLVSRADPIGPKLPAVPVSFRHHFQRPAMLTFEPLPGPRVPRAQYISAVQYVTPGLRPIALSYACDLLNLYRLITAMHS